MKQIKVDGCYPERCVRLLELVPEQVMDMILEWYWANEHGGHFADEGRDITFEELNNNAWINKGWKLWSRSHRTALYKHDGRWHLIQFFGEESMEERNA